jgi:hypothetical protein
VTQLLREFITAKEASDMETEAEAIKAQAQLDIMERALKEFEVAKWLIDTQGVEAVSEALRRVEERRDDANSPENDDDGEDDENSNNPAHLRDAMRHRAAPTSVKSSIKGKEIILGRNKTKVGFGGVEKKNTTKSFSNAKSMSEDQITKSSNGELPWLSRKGNNVSKVQLIKSACAKVRAAKESENPYKLNAVMENFLRKKAAETRALKEAALTPAQRSILPHPSAAEGSYKVPARVPSEFDSAAQRALDTKARIPAEFAPKIEATKDRSFGAMARSTKAAQTIARPVASKDGIVNPETNSQGEIADKYWPHPKAAVTKQAKDKTNPETREGQWPADPANPWYPEEAASSREPESRW